MVGLFVIGVERARGRRANIERRVEKRDSILRG